MPCWATDATANASRENLPLALVFKAAWAAANSEGAEVALPGLF